MNKSLLSLTLTMLLSACVTDSNAVKNYELELEWVNTANAEADAKAALAQGDFRLMAVPGRGEIIPGIESSKRGAYSLKCGTRIIPGMTDAVRGDSHLKLLQKATEYGAAYNAYIIEQCIP